MKKFLWVISFTLGAPALMGLSLWLLISLPGNRVTPPNPQVLTYSSDTPNSKLVIPSEGFSISFADGRTLIVKNYLHSYNSPLEPYAKLLVDTADKYHLDYKLMPAIAQQESNLCKKIPPDSHNCWGFGIYGNTVTRFDNYNQAIEIVAHALKKDYLDQGLDTPEKIMAKYTPPSTGSWAAGVSTFLTDLE